MLVVSGLLGVASVAAVYLGARIAMGFGRDVRSAIFAKVETFSQVEVNQFGPASLITRNTNDVQQVQTVLFFGLTIMVSAPILIVGGVIMALRTDVPLSGLLLVVLPLMALVIGARHEPGDPAVPGDAGEDRPDQPGHARDAGRRPGHPRVRADAATRRSASTTPAATCSTRRCRSAACSRSRSR